MKKLVLAIVAFLIGMLAAWVCLNLTNMDSALATTVSVIVSLCALKSLEKLTDNEKKKKD